MLRPGPSSSWITKQEGRSRERGNLDQPTIFFFLDRGRAAEITRIVSKLGGTDKKDGPARTNSGTQSSLENRRALDRRG